MMLHSRSAELEYVKKDLLDVKLAAQYKLHKSIDYDHNKIYATFE